MTVIPVEHIYPSECTLHYSEETNSQKMRLELQLREEIRETAQICEEKYKAKMAQYFNKRVKQRGSAKGDLVL